MGVFVPDWISAILLVLTALSFVPQLLRFRTGHGVKDIGLIYVFFNLVSALEQFFATLYWVPLYGNEERDLTTTDWWSFAQTTLVFLMFIIYFFLTLNYSAAGRLLRTAYASLFVLLLLLTVVPAIIVRLNCRIVDGRPEEDWEEVLVFGFNFYYGHRIVSLIAFASVFFQINRARALSIVGLIAQAFVFAAVAVSWLGRLSFDTSNLSWYEWYVRKGWAFVDNAIYALVQLILLAAAGVASRRTRQQQQPQSSTDAVTDERTDERQPLLQGQQTTSDAA